jgi:hypothetical protein
VIVVFAYRLFLHSAHAVDRPKAPLPTIKMDEGISDEDETMIRVQEQKR